MESFVKQTLPAALAQSSALPPPRATRKSICSSRIFCAQVSTSVVSGFGET